MKPPINTGTDGLSEGEVSELQRQPGLKKRKVRIRKSALTPILSIGKGGLTEGMIAELKRQLGLKKRIKVRIRTSALAGKGEEFCSEGRKKFAQEVAEKCNANLFKLKGYIISLSKK